MPKLFRHILFSILLGFCCTGNMQAWQQKDGGKIEVFTDRLYGDDRTMAQDVFITAQTNTAASLSLQCYYYRNPADSIKVYKHASEQKLKKGMNKLTLTFPQQKADYYLEPGFAGVMRNTGSLPVGNYKIFVSLRTDSTITEHVFSHDRDSILSIASPLRKGISTLLRPVANTGFVASAIPATPPAFDNVGKAFARNGKKMERYFKKKGLTPKTYQEDGKEIIDLYYQEWFVGRYELPSKGSVSAALAREQQAINNNINSFTKNNIGDHQSLLSQFREMKKESREHSELSGEIALSANFSNDQAEYAAQDNNYYEARGTLEFPLLDIPVSLSGYYTTQDKNREAKASFVHFRYDAEKAKEQLMKLIASYNKRYEQAITQGGSYEMIYGQFAGSMQAEKDKAIAELKKQFQIEALDPASFDPEILKEKALAQAMQEKDKLQDSLMDGASGSGSGKAIAGVQAKAEKARQKAEDTYAAALEKYRRIMELEQKIRKYEAMMAQYKNTSYYDSLLAYDKVKDLKNIDDMSYKDMAKKAAALLPEGKVKGVMTGLTSFDAGMFPKYVSSYTMSGQMLKGADLGYDAGFAVLGITYGRTEYIDRTGNVESYKAYSGRVQLKPLARQNLGLVYYGYSPGKKLLNDNAFFKGGDVSLPSFRNPVHIIAATYSGELSKYATLEGEFANANKPAQSQEARNATTFRERSAYNLNLTGTLPQTSISLTAGYEYAGKAFENNTLPVIMAGTERFSLKGKGDFFRSFLTLGAEYNYLIQNSLNTKGNNVRWGFDIATHSKRYPSLYLSFKPFSTFRSFNDTLSIEQKPLLGEVWTGRVNYQVKRLDKAIRFTLLYNRNTSTMDTVTYGSSLVQFSTIYSHKTTMLALNLGTTQINTNYIETAYPAYNNNQFINLSAGGKVAKNILLNGGTDLARSDIGISRYGCFLGSTYTFFNIPIMIRANFRYSNYKLQEALGWKPIYSGGLELAWRFRMKLREQ